MDAMDTLTQETLDYIAMWLSCDGPHSAHENYNNRKTMASSNRMNIDPPMSSQNLLAPASGAKAVKEFTCLLQGHTEFEPLWYSDAT